MNINIIHKIENLALDKIRVVKPYNFENKYFFNIFYDRNYPLLIQTPICILPYRYMLYDNKYFQIDMFFDIVEFKNLIEVILKHINNKIKKKYKTILNDKNYIDTVMKMPNNMFKLRAKNTNVDSINVYNYNRNRIDIRNIERNDQIKALIQIEKFLIDKDSYSFLFKIIQIKKHCIIDPFSPNIKCLFVENEIDNINIDININKQLEKYERFSKMLKMGVPMMGVIQKMQLEGFEEEDIAQFTQLKNRKIVSINPSPHSSSLPLPPPPPPPPPPPLSFIGIPKSAPQQPLAFLNDIKNGQFTLKKAVITEVDKKELLKAKLMKFVDKSKPAPPTLEDILNAKSRLKSNKICKN